MGNGDTKKELGFDESAGYNPQLLKGKPLWSYCDLVNHLNLQCVLKNNKFIWEFSFKDKDNSTIWRKPSLKLIGSNKCFVIHTLVESTVDVSII